MTSESSYEYEVVEETTEITNIKKQLVDVDTKVEMDEKINAKIK